MYANRQRTCEIKANQLQTLQAYQVLSLSKAKNGNKCLYPSQSKLKAQFKPVAQECHLGIL
jgi:hypothetical protein